MIEFTTGHAQHEVEITSLFRDVFSASEGVEEGALIGALSHDMMATTPQEHLYVFSAWQKGVLSGCILFSRLEFAQDDRLVFILSPVAIRTDRQNSGIGQKLIRFGLQRLRENGVDYVLTYGDPNYYCKTGFLQISEAFAQAPVALSYPHGWLGQPLSKRGEAPLRGASRCVDALNKPELW